MTTLEKLEELIYHGFKETDKRFQETDKRIKENDDLLNKILDRLAKQVGDITDSLGRFAESTVFPSIIPLFKKRGIQINQLWGRLPAVQNGREMELDIAGIGPECAAVIEVKLRLKQDHVEKFLQSLPQVFDYFPLLRRPVLYGGVAAMSIDKDVDRFAYKQGLFVLTQTGDNLRIWNDKAFKPRSFHSTKSNGAQKRKKA
jgi:hypothetical protein